MKRHILCAAFLAWISTLITSAAAPENGELQGKWTATRTNSEGEVYTMQLEISDPKFAFELRDVSGETRFLANGRLKAQKAGRLKFFTLSDIEAGRSADDLEFVDDERSSVYTIRDGRLIIASNFDRERENERPGIDTYTRVENRRAATTADPVIEKLLGTWDLVLTIGENSLEYELEIRKADGKLAATLISPRSGRHNFESIAYQDGELKMEIDREIEGQPTRLIYTGKLSGAGFSGRVAIKGDDDRSAAWSATR